MKSSSVNATAFFILNLGYIAKKLIGDDMNTDEEDPSNGAPHTNAKAKPIKWKLAPSNRKVIEVKNALYRNAVLSGKFLIAQTVNAYGTSKDGHKTIEVECYWYGWKPKNRWIRITLTNEEKEVEDYSEHEVVSNIGAFVAHSTSVIDPRLL